MKLMTLITLLTVASFCPALAAPKGNNGNTEQTLMKIEQDMADALAKNDTSAFERHMAEGSMFTDPDGKVLTKSQLIGDMKSGDLKITSSKLDDMKVRVFKDTAVVTYGSTDSGSYKGKDISGRYRWTDVFVKSAGRWQIVSGQGTRIGQ